MNAQRNIKIGSKIYIGFSAFSLGYVAILSLISPQSTMNLVATTLTNTDAISSIRGIYGGVGLVITIQLIYLLLTDYTKGLVFLSLFWAFYAVSRLITLYSDGPLGEFATFWMVNETVFSMIGIGLLLLTKKNQRDEFRVATTASY